MITDRKVVDRTLEEMLRLKSVELGFTPDRLSFSNVSDYEAAKEAIANNLGFVIEIYGVGASKYRSEIEAGIYINKSQENLMDYSYWNATAYENTNTESNPVYDAYTGPKKIYNLEYDLRLTSTHPDGERALEKLYYATFAGAYFRSIDENNELKGEFMLIEETFSDHVGFDKLKEYIKRLIVHDIFLEPVRNIEADIPSIQTVKQNTFIQDKDKDLGDKNNSEKT